MRVLDTEINIEANRTLFWTRYRLLFLLLVYTALADAISTTYFMSQIGPHHEMNAVVRALTYTLGITWGPLLGKAMQVVAVWLISVFTPNLTRWVCSAIIGCNIYAVYVNMHA